MTYRPPTIAGRLLFERVDHHARAEFRLEPRRLRGHDVTRVGDVDELLHRNGVEGERRLHLAAVDTLLELAQTSYSTYKIDAFITSQVVYTQYVAQDIV